MAGRTYLNASPAKRTQWANRCMPSTSGALASLATILAFFLSVVPCLSQNPNPGTVVDYQLLSDSQLIDSCPISRRPHILLPLRGSFHLRLVDEGPLISTFAVEKVSFEAGWDGGPHYRLTGSGTYQIGGEVALVQDLVLNLAIDSGGGAETCYFT